MHPGIEPSRASVTNGHCPMDDRQSSVFCRVKSPEMISFRHGSILDVDFGRNPLSCRRDFWRSPQILVEAGDDHVIGPQLTLFDLENRGEAV